MADTHGRLHAALESCLSLQPIHYRLENQGFLLYSVGPNGKDDEGREWRNSPEGNDVPIRAPPERVAK
jgi:hypothetical protein